MADRIAWNGCPTRFAAGILGDKWVIVLLRDILLRNLKRFQDFRASPERIATNILTERLSRMEKAGLLTKRRDPENGRSFLYEPTEMGQALTPVVLEMMRWSAHWDPDTDMQDLRALDAFERR